MKIFRVLIITIVLVAVVFAGWRLLGPEMNKTEITNFEECAAAGYPIQESFPEVCRTPDGQSFTRPL